MGLRRHDNPIHTAVGLVLLLLAWHAAPAGAQTDPEAERDAVRDQQDRIAEQLDVLQASDAEIDAALDEIDAALAFQEEALAAAQVEVAAANVAQRQAESDLRAAHRDVEILERAIVEMAVASYVHPPTADLVQSLQAQSLSDAVIQQIYLDARAQRDLDLLDLLESAEQRAEDEAARVADAVVAAEQAVAAADAELARLDDERRRQADFAAELQGRIDGALAEAAALADLDAELSARIVAEQAELIARLPPPPAAPAAPDPPSAPVTTAPPTTAAPPTTVSEGEVASPPATTTTTRPSTTTTTRPPTRVNYDPPPVPPLETVRGFTVHAEIAGDVEALLAAAAEDGLTFGGSAYRSTERQIELRIAHCGPTEYDIWYKPASLCSPPTAVPGRSLHEQGRALDLTFEGRLITSRANEGFQWLADNAASYGLFNLPSEPWHWSTTGG